MNYLKTLKNESILYPQVMGSKFYLELFYYFWCLLLLLLLCSRAVVVDNVAMMLAAWFFSPLVLGRQAGRQAGLGNNMGYTTGVLPLLCNSPSHPISLASFVGLFRPVIAILISSLAANGEYMRLSSSTAPSSSYKYILLPQFSSTKTCLALPCFALLRLARLSLYLFFRLYDNGNCISFD